MNYPHTLCSTNNGSALNYYDILFVCKRMKRIKTEMHDTPMNHNLTNFHLYKIDKFIELELEIVLGFRCVMFAFCSLLTLNEKKIEPKLFISLFPREKQKTKLKFMLIPICNPDFLFCSLAYWQHQTGNCVTKIWIHIFRTLNTANYALHLNHFHLLCFRFVFFLSFCLEMEPNWIVNGSMRSW